MKKIALVMLSVVCVSTTVYAGKGKKVKKNRELIAAAASAAAVHNNPREEEVILTQKDIDKLKEKLKRDPSIDEVRQLKASKGEVLRELASFDKHRQTSGSSVGY